MSTLTWSLLDPSSAPAAAPARPAPADLDPETHRGLLRQDPQAYSELVRNVAAYGIYLIDRDGRVTSWNQGAQNITGFRESEIVGQPYAALFAETALREGVPPRAIGFARANQHCRDEQLRRRKSGEEFVAQTTLDAVRGDDGQILGYVEVFHDISELKRREAQLYENATRDPLTGLCNRGHWMQCSAQEVERARRFGEPLSVVKIEVDHFRRLNGQWGAEAGEQVLRLVARCCGELTRRIDVVGRIGPAEFALTLPRANKEPAFENAQRLRLKLAEQRIVGQGREFGFTASMGIAALRAQTRDLAELLRNADAALFRAQREGHNRAETWFE